MGMHAARPEARLHSGFLRQYSTVYDHNRHFGELTPGEAGAGPLPWTSDDGKLGENRCTQSEVPQRYVSALLVVTASAVFRTDAPRASSARTSRSRETEESPLSILATWDWLEPISAAAWPCVSLRRRRRARRSAASFIRSSILLERRFRALRLAKPVGGAMSMGNGLSRERHTGGPPKGA